MMIGKCKLTYGDKEFDIEVLDLTIDYEYSSAYRSASVMNYIDMAPPEIKIRGIINKGNIMYKNCVDEETITYGDGHSPDSLAREIKDLDLDEKDRILRKYKVVNLDGTLTRTGEKLLANLLFDEDSKNKLVEKLQKLEVKSGNKK